jgi:two-component system response regulator CpxR
MVRVAHIAIEPPSHVELPDVHAPDARVLVVDDDQDLRDTVAAALETEGYRVRCAANGAQALALMHGYRPEAIVLDLSMPIMSGWELLEAVRERRELREVHVLVLSAMRAPPGVEHLDKPVSLGDLLSTLDRMCPP